MTAKAPNQQGIHLISGGISGFIACVLLQPLDFLKTRIQQSGQSPTKPLKGTLWSTARQVVRDESMLGLWKGTSATVMRNVPGSAMYFLALHEIKPLLASGKMMNSDAVNISGGIIARVTVGYVMMPITVIKIRMEVPFV